MFNNINITLSGLWFTFLLSTLGPLIVGVITKKFVEGKTKMYLLALVTVILQTLTLLGQSFNLGEFLTKVVMAFILSVGIHYQILRPAGITSPDGLVNKVLPDVGLGTSYEGTDLLPDPNLIAAENAKKGITDADYPHEK